MTSSASVLAPGFGEVGDRLRAPGGRVDASSRAGARRSAVAWPIPDEQPVIRTARETSAIRRAPRLPGLSWCRHARSTLSSGQRCERSPFRRPARCGSRSVPSPSSAAADDAIVRVEATGVCGSDLHIYHGRVAIEPGFAIGHEYVGTVIAAGDGVTEVAVGDRVLGTYCTACGDCFFCRRGDFHKCDSGRVFGHGATLGSLQGAQAEQVLVPNADLTLRRVPEGMSDDVALFAGDVMGTGLPRGRRDAARPSREPATRSRCSGSARSGSARCRSRGRRAPQR